MRKFRGVNFHRAKLGHFGYRKLAPLRRARRRFNRRRRR